MKETQHKALLAIAADFDFLTHDEAINVIHNTLGKHTTYQLASTNKLYPLIGELMEQASPLNSGYNAAEAKAVQQLYLAEFKHDYRFANLKPITLCAPK